MAFADMRRRKAPKFTFSLFYLQIRKAGHINSSTFVLFENRNQKLSVILVVICKTPGACGQKVAAESALLHNE